MSQNIVAIDCSETGARIAVIRANMRRAVLADVKNVAFESHQTAAERWALVRQALPAVVESIIVGVESVQTSTRLLHFPFQDVRKLAMAVDFELEAQIPYALQEVAIAWSMVGRPAGGQGVEVLAAIAPRQQLVELLALQSSVGIEPRALVMPAVALGEFLPRQGPHQTGIISFGARLSHLVVGRNSLQFVRTLRCGGNDVDAVIAQRLRLSLAEAKKLKETEGRLQTWSQGMSHTHHLPLSKAIALGLQPLLAHLLMTFKALPPAQTPQRLWITGGLSRLPGLADYLAQRLNISVDLLDVRGEIQAMQALRDSKIVVEPTLAKPAAMDAAYLENQGGPHDAIALGMTMALFRHGREVPLNFRHGSLAYQGDLQVYRGQIMRLALGLMAVFLLAIGASVVQYSVLRAEEAEVNAAFCQATQRIVGREICDPTAALSTLKQNPGAEGTTIPSYSAAMLLYMLSKTLQPGSDVKFDELDLRVDAIANQPERLTGKGEADSFEATEALISMIKRDVCVEDAEVSKLQRTQGGRVSFNVTVKVACPPGVQPGMQQQSVAQLYKKNRAT